MRRQIQPQSDLTPAQTLAYAQALGVSPNQVPAAIAAGINPADVASQQAAQKAQAESQAQFQQLQPILSQMKTLVPQVNTGENSSAQARKIKNLVPAGARRALLPESVLEGSKLDALPLGFGTLIARQDDRIAQMVQLQSTVANIYKTFGDSGRLSDQDIQRAINLIPDPLDPKSTAEAKMEQLESLFQKAQSTPPGTHQPGQGGETPPAGGPPQQASSGAAGMALPGGLQALTSQQAPAAQASVSPRATAQTEGTQASALDRLRLSFGDARGREAYIREKGLATDETGTILQPEGLDAGDITSKIGGLFPMLGSIAGASAAAAPAAAIAAGTGGAGAIPGAALVGSGAAVGGAGGEAIRQVLGKVLGTRGELTSEEAVKDIRNEAALGLLTPIGGKIVSSGLARFATKPIKKMTAAFSPAPSEVLGGMFPAEEFVKRGYAGTLTMMKNKANRVLEQTKPIVNEAKEKLGSKVVATENDIQENLLKIADEYRMAGPVREGTEKVLDDLLREFKGKSKITLQMADKARAALDKSIAADHARVARQAAQGQTTDIAGTTLVQKKMADFLRNVVNKSLPEEAAKANRDFYIAKLMQGAVARREVKKGLLSVIGRSVSTGLGSAVGLGAGLSAGQPGIGAMLGGVAGLGISTAGASVPARTVFGQAARIPAAIAGRASQTPQVGQGLFNILGRGVQ